METGLYYDISGYQHQIPSLEVESEPSWHPTGQFVDVVYPQGQSGACRLAVDVLTYTPPLPCLEV